MKLSKKTTYLSILSCVFIAIILFITFSNPQEKIEETKSTALVSVAKIKKQEMAKMLALNGVVNFVPETIGQVSFNAEVIVKTVLVQLGQKVKKGQIILQLTPSPDTQANLTNAKNAVEFAKKDFARLNNLKSKYLATNAEVQNAEQILLKAEATLRSLQIANKQISEPIKASTDGVITSLNIQANQIVAPGVLLLSIGSKLQAQFNIPAIYKDKIKLGGRILIRNLNNPDHVQTSKVIKISGRIDPASNMMNFIAPLEISSGFIAGDSITGQISLDQPSQQLAVPRSAVLYLDTAAYVFINKSNTAAQKWINLLYQDESTAYIKGDVSVGDSVVVLGNYELESGIKLRVESQL